MIYISDSQSPPIQGADNSRQPTEKELELAHIQGKAFYEAVSKVNFA